MRAVWGACSLSIDDGAIRRIENSGVGLEGGHCGRSTIVGDPRLIRAKSRFASA